MTRSEDEVAVPDEWRGAEYEYRLGYAEGVNRPRAYAGRWNPVSSAGLEGKFRREAWYAGRRDARELYRRSPLQRRRLP